MNIAPQVSSEPQGSSDPQASTLSQVSAEPSTSATEQRSTVSAAQNEPEVTTAHILDSESVQSLRLGFVRGIAPSKWANRWAEAVPEIPLELIPLPVRKSQINDIATDIRLERLAPGQSPTDNRFAIQLYSEAVALVVDKDHDLAEESSVSLSAIELVNLLSHPDHLADWPTPQPWANADWAPKDASDALEIVATGAGAILLPLPFARHLADKKKLAVIPVLPEAGLAGSIIWASWLISRDAGDVQQLAGIMRGRTARSQRPGAIDPIARAEALATATAATKAKQAPKKKQTKALPKNSRGAQLAAAQEKRDMAKRAKAAERKQAQKRKRR